MGAGRAETLRFESGVRARRAPRLSFAAESSASHDTDAMHAFARKPTTRMGFCAAAGGARAPFARTRRATAFVAASAVSVRVRADRRFAVGYDPSVFVSSGNPAP